MELNYEQQNGDAYAHQASQHDQPQKNADALNVSRAQGGMGAADEGYQGGNVIGNQDDVIGDYIQEEGKSDEKQVGKMAVKSQGNQDPFDYHEEKDPFIIKNKRKNESNYYNKTEGDKKKFRFPGQKGDKDEGPQIQVQVDMKDDSFLQRQHAQEIENHTVYFPFKPYECQTTYMTQVVRALQNKENALLESPTGTGKTLSLLCASLAWLEQERKTYLVGNRDKNEIPKIIYCSRTHSQLAQVQKELKNTAFNPRTVLLASRDHLCVNASINMNKGFALNAACRNSQKGINPCVYYKNKDKGQMQMPWAPLDIEELHKVAERHQFCPYYANNGRAAAADLIFMPYNYLLEEKIRENFTFYGLNFRNAIIIFDEAHNIATCAEEVASFELKAKHLDQCITELHSLAEHKAQSDQKEWRTTDEQISSLKKLTEQFLKFLNSYNVDAYENPMALRLAQGNRYMPDRSIVLTGGQIFNIFFEGTTMDDYDTKGKQFKSSLETEWGDIQVRFDNALQDISDASFNQVKTQLQNWFDVLKKVMVMWASGAASQLKNSNKATTTITPGDKLANADDFYVFIYDEEEKQAQTHIKRKSKGFGFDQSSHSRVLGFWCFNAGVCFKQLKELEPRSIILTSGTLSPMNSFEAELQLEFKYKLENPHVIPNEQVQLNILRRSENNVPFNFSYQNKDNTEMLDDLAFTVAKIAKNVPGGILIFFPSYWLMNNTYERWERCGALSAIQKHKLVYREPKKAAEYQLVMDRYYSQIFEENKGGAVLMGVCRGRISEGLDFSDNAARCVIIVGIPFPQMTDPKVILKKEYLDAQLSIKRSPTQINSQYGVTQLAGKDWYNQQATRSVNQAIGRVIRHVQDYGIIVLVDERYTYSSNRSQISRWLRDRVTVPDKFETFDLKTRAFFQKMKAFNFQPKVKQLEQLRVEFDDAGGVEKGHMPIIINSKKKYDNGPSNNQIYSRRNKNQNNRGGAMFGFYKPDSDDEDSDGPKVDKNALALKPSYSKFQHKMALKDTNITTQQTGPMTITKMVRNMQEKKRNLDQMTQLESAGTNGNGTHAFSATAAIKKNLPGNNSSGSANGNGSTLSKIDAFKFTKSSGQVGSTSKVASQRQYVQQTATASLTVYEKSADGKSTQVTSAPGKMMAPIMTPNVMTPVVPVAKRETQSASFGISSNTGEKKVNKTKDLIGSLKEVLSQTELKFMVQVLQHLKGTRHQNARNIEGTCKQLRQIFFKKDTNPRVNDKKFDAKKACFAQLRSIVPTEHRLEFDRYFADII